MRAYWCEGAFHIFLDNPRSARARAVRRFWRQFQFSLGRSKPFPLRRCNTTLVLKVFKRRRKSSKIKSASRHNATQGVMCCVIGAQKPCFSADPHRLICNHRIRSNSAAHNQMFVGLGHIPIIRLTETWHQFWASRTCSTLPLTCSVLFAMRNIATATTDGGEYP